MEVVNAVVPNAPAGTQSSASATPVNPGSPTLAKGASLATAGPVVAGTGLAVQAVATDAAAAGVLFGMVLAQLAVVKETAVKEADAKNADVPQTQVQPSPDQISMLASLVPALVTLQVGPQAITVSGETSDAQPKDVSKPGTLTSPVVLNAISGTAQPVISTDLGKDLKAGQLDDPKLVLDRTIPGVSQMPVATPMPTPSVVMPPTLTQDQGQSFQTLMTPVPSAEVDNQSGTATAHEAGFNAASLSAPATSHKSPDLAPAALPPSLLIDAIPANKDKDRDDLLKGILENKNGSLPELTPAGGDKIPTEFIANHTSSPAPLTEATAPQATVAMSAPPATATMIPRETIRLELGPSDLGRLTLQVSVQSHQVQATVGVEHRGLGEFLATSQGALDQAMRQHGLRLDELHVESLLNPAMLGPGDGRTGFLDHGQSRQDASGFMREQVNQSAESEAIMAKGDNVLESLSNRYRINLFA